MANQAPYTVSSLTELVQTVLTFDSQKMVAERLAGNLGYELVEEAEMPRVVVAQYERLHFRLGIAIGVLVGAPLGFLATVIVVILT